MRITFSCTEKWELLFRILGLEIWIEVEFGASHFSFHVDNRWSKFLKVSEDAFLDRQTSFTSPEFRFRAPNFNLNFKIWRLLFLSNLISGPQNSNSAPSIWSGPNFLHFSSHQNLDFVLGWSDNRRMQRQMLGVEEKFHKENFRVRSERRETIL